MHFIDNSDDEMTIRDAREPCCGLLWTASQCLVVTVKGLGQDVGEGKKSTASADNQLLLLTAIMGVPRRRGAPSYVLLLVTLFASAVAGVGWTGAFRCCCR